MISVLGHHPTLDVRSGLVCVQFTISDANEGTGFVADTGHVRVQKAACNDDKLSTGGRNP